MNLANLLLLGLAGTAAPLALPSATAPAPGQDPAPARAELLFPMAHEALRIEVGPENNPSLYDVVVAYGEVTDQAFLLSPETTSILQSTSTGLTRSLEIPRPRVQAIFEQFLIANDMVLSIRHAETPRLLSIVSLNGPQRAGVRAHTFEVDVEDIDTWDDHAAVLVSTVVHLPNTDVRQLSNSLRTLIIDANTQQILPAGNSNNLVLTGFGSDVAALVRMMQRVDEASRVAPRDAEETDFAVIALKHTNAHALAATLDELTAQATVTQVTQAGAMVPTPNPVRIVPDAHSNSLLIQAPPARMEELENLVKLLDRPVDPGEEK